MLEVPEGIPVQGLPNIDDLSFFEPSRKFILFRLKRIEEVVQAFEDILYGNRLKWKTL